ncbi:DNA-directed DNA polymerase [Chytriomyces confervae]|uniref:DNA-directed DNA polymerase n=1 Tax=Chytriomyces confervae TaxID=246404 RepID=A0A507FDK2_9FUNG|nr:DNA-directed DNA polymerase [Chytriomyces confervae]
MVTGDEVSIPSMWRCLLMLGVTHEMLTEKVVERSKDERALFILSVGWFDAEQLVFAGAAAVSRFSSERNWRWNKGGYGAARHAPMVRKEKKNVCTGICLDGYISFSALDDRERDDEDVFMEWLEEHLLPKMSGFPQSNSVLVLEEAISDKCDHILDLCINAGIILIFMPPYTRDYSPGKCMAYTVGHKDGKLDSKGVQCRVLGIKEKGYLLVETDSGRIFKSVHVKFPKYEPERGDETSEEEPPELLSDSEGEEEEPQRGRSRQQRQQTPEPEEQNSEGEEEARSPSPIRILQRLDKVAARDINSAVDQSNIIDGRRRQATYAFSTMTEDPKSIGEALQRDDAPKWKDAILDELNSLVKNGTWEVIDLKKEPTKNIADTKWVHKKKQDAAGVFEKYKSQLVVQGFTQVEGVDYDETFAPVVRSTTIKAYLNSKMDYNVVIRIPDGYELLDPQIDRKRHALRLLKGLYGTKQGGYLWNEEFKGTLVSIGFKQAVSDPGLFRIQRNGSELLITLYVDDILIATDNEDLRKWVENQLVKRYKVKFLGEIHTLLGSVISYDLKGGRASFQQSSYLELIGQPYQLENTKYQTPLEAGIWLPEDAVNLTMEQYRSLLGAVILPGVQFVLKATEAHWTALRQLTGYLVNTSKLELRYMAGKANLIEAWVDASHLSEGAYGVSGHAVFVGGNLTVIHEDNQAAIASSRNAIVNDRTRHMLGKTTFICEAMKECNIESVFVPTKDQKADGLTKAKGLSEFERFRARMGTGSSVAG